MALRDSGIHKAVASFDIPASDLWFRYAAPCRTMAHRASVDSFTDRDYLKTEGGGVSLERAVSLRLVTRSCAASVQRAAGAVSVAESGSRDALSIVDATRHGRRCGQNEERGAGQSALCD